ncbi:MAG: hypothetical protein V7K69_22150 [Nostoc sp.]|uniref:hypothetical protein n=1 Tax=Nostoc sp. TaxID=1180 RepID=UPI002FF5F844
MQTWGKRGSAINVEMRRYRESVLAGLLEDGYTVIDADDAESGAVIEGVRLVGYSVGQSSSCSIKTVTVSRLCKQFPSLEQIISIDLPLKKIILCFLSSESLKLTQKY